MDANDLERVEVSKRRYVSIYTHCIGYYGFSSKIIYQALFVNSRFMIPYLPETSFQFLCLLLGGQAFGPHSVPCSFRTVGYVLLCKMSNYVLVLSYTCVTFRLLILQCSNLNLY